MSDSSYILVTPAHDEAGYLERTIASVLAQSVLPVCWVIVSDRSTDATDDIIRGVADLYPWIHYLRLEGPRERNFGYKVEAFRRGYELVNFAPHGFIGNLDADICLPPDYYAGLIARFNEHPRLGIAGGFMDEEQNGVLQPRPYTSEHSVPHAAQLVRRQCFSEIGGYTPMRFGGEDWQAEVSARMHGWEAQSFAALRGQHLRPARITTGILRCRYDEGRMDYSMGSHPLFELVKCARRIGESPRPLTPVVRLAGFLSGYWRREARPVTNELVDFLRDEQLSRLHLRPAPKGHGRVSTSDPTVPDASRVRR